MDHAGTFVDLPVGQIRRIGPAFCCQRVIGRRIKFNFFADGQIGSDRAFIPQFQIFNR